MATVSKPVLNVLRAIVEGRSHRATHATYEQLVSAQLAIWCGANGWQLLDAGRAVLAQVNARKVEVHERHYELTHGRKPRGEGCWAFHFGSLNAEATWIKDAAGCMVLDYAQARQLARVQAAADGHDVIFVAT